MTGVIYLIFDIREYVKLQPMFPLILSMCEKYISCDYDSVTNNFHSESSPVANLHMFDLQTFEADLQRIFVNYSHFDVCRRFKLTYQINFAIKEHSIHRFVVSNVFVA